MSTSSSRRAHPRLAAGLFVLLLGSFLAQPGCGLMASYLPTAIAYAQDAAFILDQTQRFVDAFFTTHPDPDLQKEVDLAAARTRSALDLALRTASGASKLNQAQVDAAFADFRVAWGDFIVLVGPLGIHAGSARLMAAPGGGLLVPDPLAVHR